MAIKRSKGVAALISTVTDTIKRPSGTAIKWPSADGTIGQSLTTDGAGNLTFTSVGTSAVVELPFSSTTDTTQGVPTIQDFTVPTTGTYVVEVRVASVGTPSGYFFGGGVTGWIAQGSNWGTPEPLAPQSDAFLSVSFSMTTTTNLRVTYTNSAENETSYKIVVRLIPY